ncbi:MAG: DUF4838 domain-containing protein [Thermoguttaceae bacterium]|jgi:hypothetical protein|nr:DUF4838 domain-containing protein [Thermoguttaceae bacterium]
MRHIVLPVLCLLTIVGRPLPAQPEHSSAFLAQDGKTAYTIVAADDEAATAATGQVASQELKEHLEAITGATFPVVKESEFDGKSPALYVGPTRFAEANGVEFDALHRESWLYKTVGDSLILAGGKTATIYAVCEFLERELGCRWFTFESAWTPKLPDIALQAWNRRGKPAFLHRELYIPHWSLGLTGQWNQEYLKFLKRNRGNQMDSPLPVSHRPGTCHTFYQYVSWEKLFDDHPEYFSMNEKGERFHGPNMHSGGQLCLSNPEVADVILARLREFIKQDREELPRERWPVIYDISQNDNFPYICKCPTCTAITEREGSESALTLTCMNKVAREIAKEHPEIMIRTFAYVSTERAPKTMRPEPNLLIQWCDLYTRSDCYRPITSPFNASRKEQLDGWKAIGANIVLWDYWNMGILNGPYFKPPRVETMVDAIGPDLRYFRDAGVISYFAEAESNLHVNPQNFHDLHVWLGYQMLNDPDQDDQALIDDYMARHYGPASGPMVAFLTDLRQVIAAEPKALVYISNPRREYQTADFLGQVIGYLREAQKLAPEGTPYRLRVNKELITPLAVILYRPELNPGMDREAILKEYEALRKQQIEAYCRPEKQEEFKKVLAEDLEDLAGR